MKNWLIEFRRFSKLQTFQFVLLYQVFFSLKIEYLKLDYVHVILTYQHIDTTSHIPRTTTHLLQPIMADSYAELLTHDCTDLDEFIENVKSGVVVLTNFDREK